MKRILLISAATILLLPVCRLYPQQKKQSLPRVLSAGMPFYPPFARTASTQGIVTLRVSTDGKHVKSVDSESGHPLLVKDAKANVRTWEFEPHKPTSFDVRFTYKLLPPLPCEMEFDLYDPQYQSTLLQLPMSVEINAVMSRFCDPAVTIEGK